MRVNLPILYMQTDSRWGQVLLGNNLNQPYNLYNYGCLDTCLSMVGSYFSKGTNPVDMNNLLKQVSAFSQSGGDYIWGGIHLIFGDITERLVNTPNALTDTQMNEIKSSLDSGFPVMVQLDYNPKTVLNEEHYVLLVDYDPTDENNFTIADPLTAKTHSLKDYLGWFKPNARATINQYVLFTGPKPVVNAPDTVTLAKDDADRRTHNSEQWIKIISYLGITKDPSLTQSEEAQTVVAGFKSRATDMENKANQTVQDNAVLTQEVKNRDTQISNLSTDLLSAEQKRLADLDALKSSMPDVSKLTTSYEGQIKTLKGTIGDLQTENGSLKTELVKSQSTAVNIKQANGLLQSLRDLLNSIFN